MWGRVGLLLIKEIKSPLNIRSNQAFELKKREDKKKKPRKPWKCGLFRVSSCKVLGILSLAGKLWCCWRAHLVPAGLCSPVPAQLAGALPGMGA